MRFRPLVALGWGVVLYSSMYLAWALLGAYGYAGTAVSRYGLLAVLLFSTVIATRALRMRTWRDVLPYSIIWCVVVAGIDAFFAAASGYWQQFLDPNLWVGYALVLLVPLVIPHPPKLQTQPASVT